MTCSDGGKKQVSFRVNAPHYADVAYGKNSAPPLRATTASAATVRDALFCMYGNFRVYYSIFRRAVRAAVRFVTNPSVSMNCWLPRTCRQRNKQTRVADGAAGVSAALWLEKSVEKGS